LSRLVPILMWRENIFFLFKKKSESYTRHVMSIKFNPNQFIKNRLCIRRNFLWYLWGGNSKWRKWFWENIFFYENDDIGSELFLKSLVSIWSRMHVRYIIDFWKCNICICDFRKNAKRFFQFELFSYNCQLRSVMKNAKMLFFLLSVLCFWRIFVI